MREAQRRLSDENAQLRRALESIAQQQKVAQDAQKQAQEPQLRDDDYADVRTVNKLAEARASAIVEQRMAQMNQHQRAQYAELALKQQFPDIERVVLDRDIEDRVRREEPEFWEAANLIQDPYRKGAALYKLMSKYKADPNIDQAKAAAHDNLSRPAPGPAQSRQSPLATGEFQQRRLSLSEAKARANQAFESTGWRTR